MFVVTLLFSFLTFGAHVSVEKETTDAVPVNYLQIAEELLKAANEQNEDVHFLKQSLARADMDILDQQLGTDNQKKAFWINVYNAFILDILRQNPGKYNNRSPFFNEKQINIAGTLLSFADIEHGILRRSKNQYSLGYFNKWRVSTFEKKMRVDKVDYRIHFALNCGAASCPPVYIYQWTTLDDTLEQVTSSYLRKTCRYDKEKQTAHITPIFSWFRKDFGGMKGVKKLLLNHQIIPDTRVKLKVTEYDWTLDVHNFGHENK